MAEVEPAFAEAMLGPKMSACTARERLFIWHYLLNGGIGAHAAAAAGCGTSSGGHRVRAHEMLQRERVLEAMDEVGRRAFRGLLLPAIAATTALIKNARHPDHAKTVGSTLSRLGLGEQSSVAVNVSGEVRLNHTDEALEQLRMLLELGVPREKLVETFGYSGLGRYERMLSEREGKRLPAPAVIEGEATEVER
jgi:hypothetical protein